MVHRLFFQGLTHLFLKKKDMKFMARRATNSVHAVSWVSHFANGRGMGWGFYWV